MPVQRCAPQVIASTGAALSYKMQAQHLATDFNTLQGHSVGLMFFPLTAGRQYSLQPLYLDKDQRFMGKLLTCMEMLDGSQLGGSYGGVDIPSSFANGWITFKDECDNLLAELPLSRLNFVMNGGKNLFFRKMPVDWGKSYITLTSTAGLSSSGLLFNVWTVNQ